MQYQYQHLLDSLKWPRTAFRRDAAVALSLLGPAVLPPLVDLLKHISEFYFEDDDRIASDIAHAIGRHTYPEVAVPALLEALKTSQHPLTRKEIACTLRLIGPAAKNAVPALVALLEEGEDFRTRRDAALALGAVGQASPRVVHRLTKLLKADEAAIRVAGARALGMLASREPSVRSSLERASADDDRRVRIHAAASLAMLEGNTATIIPTLLSSLREDEDDVRIESLIALRMVKPSAESFGVLLRGLDDPNAAIRREVAWVFEAIGPAAAPATPHLIRALQDANVPARSAAAGALLAIGSSSPELVKALTTALSDGDARVRDFAALTLQTMGPKGRKAAPALRTALYEQRPALCIRAATALLAVSPDDPANVEALVQLLGSNYLEVRIIAASVLVHMGSAACMAVPTCISLMKEQDAWIREQALHTWEICGSNEFPEISRLFRTQAQGQADIGLKAIGFDLVPRLIDVLRAKQFGPEGTAVVIGMLASFGSIARDAIPDLADLENSPNAKLRVCASVALETISGDSTLEQFQDVSNNRVLVPRDRGRARKGGRLREGSPNDTVSQHLDAAIATVATDATIDDQLKGFRELGQDYRLLLTKRLEPVLNAKIQEMAHDTIEEKGIIADFVNAELLQHGLAVKCPKTGLPAKLVADVGNWPGIGRFQIFVTAPDGKRHRTSSETVPKLEFVAAASPKDPDTHFQGKVGPKASHSGRSPAD